MKVSKYIFLSIFVLTLAGCNSFEPELPKEEKIKQQRQAKLKKMLNFYKARRIPIYKAELKKQLPIKQVFKKKIIVSREHDKKINAVLGKASMTSGHGIIKYLWIFDDGTLLKTDTIKEPKDSRGFYQYHYFWSKMNLNG